MVKTVMIVGLIVAVMGCVGSRTTRIGMAEGKFTPCPKAPNCVSSQATDKLHAIEPFSCTGSPEEVRARLLAVVQGMKRAKVVTAQERYLHVEFTSAVFRFVDDVEFYLDDEKKVVQIRSASRVGRSDFGVNRRRMEAIRKLFNEAP